MEPIFSTTEAFERNLGLVTPEEQSRLGRATVAIVGCGGVGGLHAHTLARLGIGRFRICDPDTFSIANFNRQIGATMATVGRNKAEVTAEMIKAINPEAEVRIIEGGLNSSNLAAFLEGTDLFLDGIDFFALPMRRQAFAEAWRRHIPALTAAPLGYSGALLVFAAGGMSFDEYFDFNDQQAPYEQFLRFLATLAPEGLHGPYMDLSTIDPARGRGPSSIVGCQLAACLVGAEAVRILLGRGASRLAPNYLQFDAYRQQFAKGVLEGGARNPAMMEKRESLRQLLMQFGITPDSLPQS